MFSKSKNLLNIPSLLRNDRCSKPVNLDKPLPNTPDEVVERPPRVLLKRQELSLELDNYTPGQYPLARYNVHLDQKLQVDAFKAAVRATHEENDLADFDSQLGSNINNFSAEQATIVATHAGESELTTLTEPDHPANSVKAIYMMSLEEIFSDKHEVIPAVLIRYTDVVGSDRLAYHRDAAIYYDDLIVQIHRTVISRGVYKIPNAPGYEYFRKHAVRVFLQIPDVPNIVNGPFYRPLGDYYIIRTDDRLPPHDWNTAPEYTKEVFISRFLQVHNSPPTDSYRAPNHYTPDTVRQLLDTGYIYPLIFLQSAHQKEEPMTPYSPIMLNCQELKFMQPTSANSFDSESVYSQESALRDDEDSASSFYPSAVNLSPLFTNPFAGNVVITFPDGSPEIYPASRASLSYDVEDYGNDQDTERSARSNNENGDPCDNYDESNSRDDDGDHEHGSNILGLVERGGQSDDSEDDMLTDHHQDGSPNAPINMAMATNPEESDIERSGHIIPERMQATYNALKAMCEELQETSDDFTPMGRAQLRLIESMQGQMAAMVSRADSDFERDDNFCNGAF
ncbi:hypothetical protein C0991_000444 [Blastosporella zonata]|nr:hypothetical protein C0991_000444 [Blastosporella zonata]